ncbi:MAG: HAD-IIIA family hydrolase [Eubacterium sp.]|jgi:3-deoxy-D-manno-octulosonate 8-phosphate phosphatase (KDO 8-P phosphatase)|nr:HAD-IIIA family hydrolase [Eubacterium sp.]
MKLLVMDVDGTLTDGKIYIGSKGEEFKSFNVKDGYAINEMLHKNGIKTAIITGRESEIVNIRARELSIDCVYQNVSDKVETLKQIVELYGISIEEVAYIGDDLNDFEAMKKCGITGCPADAVDEIKNISDYTSKFNGGDGAIRDFVDWILKNKV